MAKESVENKAETKAAAKETAPAVPPPVVPPAAVPATQAVAVQKDAAPAPGTTTQDKFFNALKLPIMANTYHFGMPLALPWLPDAAKLAGLDVKLKDTGMNAFETFFAYANGEIQYEHIDNPEQRRVNDWLTVFTVMNTAWPYVPILGTIGIYRYSRNMMGTLTESDGLKTVGALTSVALTMPLNVPVGLYQAANFISTKIRIEEMDKAMIKLSEDLPKKLGESFAPLTESAKDVKANAFVDKATKLATTLLFAAQMPLMGTYKGVSAVGDATHENRVEQYAATVGAAPVIGVAWPFLALPKAYSEAERVVDATGISRAATKFFNELPKTAEKLVEDTGVPKAATKLLDDLSKSASHLFDTVFKSEKKN